MKAKAHVVLRKPVLCVVCEGIFMLFAGIDQSLLKSSAVTVGAM